MKKRVFNLLNFIAFNLLFFGVYLYFVSNDFDTRQQVNLKGTTAAVKNRADATTTVPVHAFVKRKAPGKIDEELGLLKTCVN